MKVIVRRNTGRDTVNLDVPVFVVNTELATVRATLRAFKRQCSSLRDAVFALGESDSPSVEMHFEVGKEVTSSATESAALIRVATLLRPLMAPSSPTNLRTVVALLIGKGLLTTETVERINELFAQADALPFALSLNGETLSAERIYTAYAEGEFFNVDPAQRAIVQSLSFGPGKHILPFVFHHICLNYAELALALIDVVLAVERQHSEVRPQLLQRPRCIYCLTIDGDFAPEEHVIPEAFGVDDMVIHGLVCAACNNRLSRLDQALCEFEPLALLRVQNVQTTKKGKFPRAEFGHFTAVKTRPRSLRFVSKTGRPVFRAEPLPNGKVRLSLNAASGRKVDVLRLARAAFKIGIGAVAFHEPEFAFHSRFDAARRFIRGEAQMPNHLILTRKGKPHQDITTTWQSFAKGTVVSIDFYGINFGLNLDETPFGLIPEMPTESLYSFWLGEKPRDGVIQPCAADCPHLPMPRTDANP